MVIKDLKKSFKCLKPVSNCLFELSFINKIKQAFHFLCFYVIKLKETMSYNLLINLLIHISNN